jgi:hypothetical protein
MERGPQRSSLRKSAPTRGVAENRRGTTEPIFHDTKSLGPRRRRSKPARSRLLSGNEILHLPKHFRGHRFQGPGKAQELQDQAAKAATGGPQLAIRPPWEPLPLLARLRRAGVRLHAVFLSNVAKAATPFASVRSWDLSPSWAALRRRIDRGGGALVPCSPQYVSMRWSM